MTLEQISTFVASVLKKWITNKNTLDKISESKDGNLLFNGNEIQGGEQTIINNTNEYTMINYDNCSTNEVIIGKWIDGKPIYRKILNVTFVTSSAKPYFIDINAYIDKFINISGFVTESQNNYMYFIPIPNTRIDSFNSQISLLGCSNKVPLDIDNEKKPNCVRLTFGNAFINNRTWTTYIKVDYTKTTDAINSFNPNMLENISEAEKIATDEDILEVFL